MRFDGNVLFEFVETPLVLDSCRYYIEEKRNCRENATNSSFKITAALQFERRGRYPYHTLSSSLRVLPVIEELENSEGHVKFRLFTKIQDESYSY